MPSASTNTAPAAAGSGAGAGAVRDAVGQAVDGVRDPGLVLIFPTADIPAAGTEAVAAADGCPVVGMTASASFAQSGALASGCAAMAFDASQPIGWGLGENASRGLSAAAQGATAAALADVPAELPYRLVTLLADPASGDQADVVAGAYRAAGPRVPLVGGGAGGAMPALYAGDRRLRDCVLAVAVGSERPIGVGIADGCRAVGVPSIVTRAEGRVLLELDGRPAEEVYREKLARWGSPRTNGEFERFAVLHPLAQPELSGTRRLRHVLGRAPGAGLYCATSLPPHAAVEFTTQDPDLIVRSAWEAVSAALEPLGDAPPAAALVFDCAGRKRALGDQLAREAATIRSSFGEPPAIAGGYTHGEIARVFGAKGDRNHALVVVALA